MSYNNFFTEPDFNTCYYLKFIDKFFEKKDVLKKSEKFKQMYAELLDQKDGNILAAENSQFNDGGHLFMFLFCDKIKSKKICSQLDEIGLVDFYRDVTDDLITGELDSDEDFKKIYFRFPEPDYRDSSHLFDRFLLKNRTIGHVMNRINKLGRENLWDIDRKILLRKS